MTYNVFSGMLNPTQSQSREFGTNPFSNSQDIHRKPRSFVPSDLYLWPWYSNSSEWRTKHVFRVNLAQMRSAVPEIFHTWRKKVHVQRQKQNLTQFTVCN